jgi:hypothetical protein
MDGGTIQRDCRRRLIRKKPAACSKVFSPRRGTLTDHHAGSGTDRGCITVLHEVFCASTRFRARYPRQQAEPTRYFTINGIQTVSAQSYNLLHEIPDMRVQVIDTGGTAHFTYRGGLFRPVFHAGREPDLAFAANLAAYLQLLARQEDPDTLFFNRELEITGDTELGLLVKNMLDAVEWPTLPRLPLAPR